MVWDFTCVDTLAPSHVHPCSVEAGSAASTAEARKISHYEDLASDYVFAPIAIETLGAMGPNTVAFVRDLSKRLITTSGDARAGQYFRQRLGMAVQRGNAAAVMGTLERGQGLLDEAELDDTAIADATD